MIHVLRFRIDQHIVNLHIFYFIQHGSVRVGGGMPQVHVYIFFVRHGFHEIFHSEQIYKNKPLATVHTNVGALNKDLDAQ